MNFDHRELFTLVRDDLITVLSMRQEARYNINKALDSQEAAKQTYSKLVASQQLPLSKEARITLLRAVAVKEEIITKAAHDMKLARKLEIKADRLYSECSKRWRAASPDTKMTPYFNWLKATLASVETPDKIPT